MKLLEKVVVHVLIGLPKGFAPHLLACLAQNNKFKLDFKLKTTRKMGRRARVAAALIRE